MDRFTFHHTGAAFLNCQPPIPVKPEHAQRRKQFDGGCSGRLQFVDLQVAVVTARKVSNQFALGNYLGQMPIEINHEGLLSRLRLGRRTVTGDEIPDVKLVRRHPGAGAFVGDERVVVECEPEGDGRVDGLARGNDAT
jgi:hypothetical protein